MITPLDIQNKVFGKGVRGYKEEEVDGFLDLITLDMERMLEENQKLKLQIKSLNEEMQRYKGSEQTVLETLEAAKALMSDISASAEKRGSMLLKNAELDAELIQREAKENVERLTEEYGMLKRRLEMFKTKYRALLEAELDKFDELSVELFPQETFPELIEERAEQPVAVKSPPPQSSGAERATIIMKGPLPGRKEAVKGSLPDSATITNLRTGE